MLEALKQGGLALGDRAVSQQTLTSEAADHVWVEYRDGDRWVRWMPPPRILAGRRAAPAGDTFAQVPDVQYHHVAIRVTAEVRRGQQLETKERRPVPDDG